MVGTTAPAPYWLGAALSASPERSGAPGMDVFGVVEPPTGR